MQEQTDDTHMLTMPQIISELAKYDIEAQRKSIYDDLAALQCYGIKIVKYQEFGKTFYYCGTRDFEMAELKILVDAIQSSKYISDNMSKGLIWKLEKSISIYDPKLLEREVRVAGRVKSMDESVYYTVDVIHSAIRDNKALQFRYFNWNVKSEEEFWRGGAFYEVNPWALYYEDECFFSYRL